MHTLSSRGRKAVGPALSYFGKQLEGVNSLHDTFTNKEGYVLLAVAENRLNFEPIKQKLNSSCRSQIDVGTSAYDNMSGRAGFRTAFAKFATRTILGRGTPYISSPSSSSSSATAASLHPRRPHLTIDPQHLVVGSGCGALINHLAFTLLEAGEGVLLPTPTYGALYNDFTVLASTNVIDVPTDASTGFKLTEELLETSSQHAFDTLGIRAKMLFLINPNNPLGILYSSDELAMALNWCRKRKIHLVVDEIYANSVYNNENYNNNIENNEDTERQFRSIVDICADVSPQTAPVAPALPRNQFKEFVGYDHLLNKLREQVDSFEAMAQTKDYRDMHNGHYDWWALPIPDKSSYQYAYSVFPGDVQELLKNKEYVSLLTRSAELIAQGWGWDLQNKRPIPEAECSSSQGWNNWSIRLFKLVLSMDAFGFTDLCESGRVFGRYLMEEEGAKFTFGGHDLTWAFYPPYTRPRPLAYETTEEGKGEERGAKGGEAKRVDVSSISVGAGGTSTATSTTGTTADQPKKAKRGDEEAEEGVFGDYVHVLYGFSKDFGLSGYRVGVLYSQNKALLTAFSNINYFTTVSNDTQDALTHLLQDEEWVDSYLASNRQLLKDSYQVAAEVLTKYNIPFVVPRAGMFLWIDLRRLLPSTTSDVTTNGTTTTAAAATSTTTTTTSTTAARSDAFETERQLTETLFQEARVLFTPGEACHAAEPGFYRCCFAWMNAESLRVGLERVGTMCAKKGE